MTTVDDDFFDEVVPSTGPGPIFVADYSSTCSVELDEIRPGESIRADAEGGYAHADCLRVGQRPVIWE